MILWLTGNSGSGKTTLAKRLVGPGVVHLDGDVMRSIWPGLGLTAEDRREQCMRVARLAKELEGQGLVVLVSVIAPYKALRLDIETLTGCKWVYVPGGKTGAKYPYEVPVNPAMKVAK